jgi:hypothetical protein
MLPAIADATTLIQALSVAKIATCPSTNAYQDTFRDNGTTAT